MVRLAFSSSHGEMLLNNFSGTNSRILFPVVGTNIVLGDGCLGVDTKSILRQNASAERSVRVGVFPLTS